MRCRTRRRVHRPGGRDDRPVAGAAAEIAGERVVDPRPARRARLLVVEGRQGHHEARRAEAALRAVVLDHRLLDRVERAVRALEVLDGQELAAVQRRHEADAGIDRAVAQPAVFGLGDDDAARPAIALGTALLGAPPEGVAPEPFEHGERRVDGLERDRLVPQKEAHAAAHQLPR
jgi:hypothetical protein